jgi:NADH-quinone oxidoreductase subunit I
MPQLGQGVLKGMGVTLKHLFGQKITRQYPEYKRSLPARSRGLLTVDMDRCIACLQCMRVCPDHCISIEMQKRDIDGSGKAKPYAVGFMIDDSRCMYCSRSARSTASTTPRSSRLRPTTAWSSRGNSVSGP